MLAKVEHRRDVRVRDARGDARLVEEHVDEGLILHEVRMDALDRDPLLEPARSVHACEVHARHPADADLVDDTVAPEEVRPRAASPVRHGGMPAGAGRIGDLREIGAMGAVLRQFVPFQRVVTRAAPSDTSSVG